MSAQSTTMLTTLVQLHDTLKGAELPLDLAGVEPARAQRAELIAQLEDYVLPRLIQIDAPLLTVVGGSTGAGKSTLVNSIIGELVTEAGVLRPTTRSPVLVHNPADAAWFEQARILPAGLAILDAPDIDSVEERNRELAAQLLAAADMWLFVTSAARYADQVPWEFLRKAADRSTAVAIVLDRTAAAAIPEVSAHLVRMLNSRGLRDSPLFTVAEGGLDRAGLLPAEAVGDIRHWLKALAEDAGARAGIVGQTLGGAVRAAASRTYELAEAYDAQYAAALSLRDAVDASYERARRAIDDACADGTLLRGEVVARWQEFVGAGDLLRALETRVSRLRDRLGNALRGKPASPDGVSRAVESGLATLVLEHAEGAAERADREWRSTATGRGLLERSPDDLSRASRALRAETERMVRDWQGSVLELVRTEGGEKRTAARYLAYGVNGLGVALMIVVFASTGGLTGAEFGIAGGSAVLGQKLLEAVFGDQAVRRLAQRAREDLQHRVADLLAREQSRYVDLVEGLGLTSGRSEQLRALARGVDDLRFRGGMPTPSAAAGSSECVVGGPE